MPRGDPPTVYLADDVDALQWVLALQVVARGASPDWPSEVRATLRQALLDERWADAVVAWMDHTGAVVDVYPSVDVASSTDVEGASSSR